MTPNDRIDYLINYLPRLMYHYRQTNGHLPSIYHQICLEVPSFYRKVSYPTFELHAPLLEAIYQALAECPEDLEKAIWRRPDPEG